MNIISFTPRGLELSKKIKNYLSDAKLHAKFEGAPSSDGVICIEESVGEWARSKMDSCEPLVFIGATGIAVRAISEGVSDKLTDSPVIVIDEQGTFVIPLLSGHMGGANELAISVAENIDAIPVITTATDLSGAFSPDLFAKENNLALLNKGGIAKVSSKALAGKAISIAIENFPPKNNADIVISSNENYLKSGTLKLCPKTYGLGIGCKKDIDPDSLFDFVREILLENKIDIKEVGAIASIDLKKDEEAIVFLSKKMRVPFITFTSEILSKANGDFEESDFVNKITGVGNVCERAAMLLTGNQGKIVVKKTSKDGMTLSLSRMN